MATIVFSSEFEALAHCDDLKIVKEVIYVVGKERSLTWQVKNLTRKANISVTAPNEDYEIFKLAFTESKNESKENELYEDEDISHKWSFQTDKWLCPEDGFVFRAVKKNLQKVCNLPLADAGQTSEDTKPT